MDLSAKYQDDSIHRYYSMPVFLRSLKDRELAFIDPRRWEDPYEDFFRKCVSISDDTFEWLETKRLEYSEKVFGEKIVTPDIRESRFVKIFGQCWTMRDESDALWRKYAPNNDGVRVRTTPNKMKEVIAKGNREYDDGSRYSTFQGTVVYLSHEKVEDYVREAIIELGMLRRDSNFTYSVLPLLTKRLFFSHESEYRFLVVFNKKQIMREPEILNNDLLKLPFDPNELFDEIVLAPSINPGIPDVSDVYEEILRNLGYRNEIRKSKAYDPPAPPSTDSLVKLIVEKGIDLIGTKK